MAARKIMILGSIGVGKTSLSNRLAFDKFETSYKATIGVDVYTTTAVIPGRVDPVKLVLWDTDGDFGLTIFKTVYLKGAAGALVVADVTRPASIDHMVALIDGFHDAVPGRPCAAVFNKVDLLDRPLDDTTRAARAADMITMTSALTGAGVREAFGDLAAAIERRNL
jgi:Ras-related protein Rab-22